MEDIDGLLNTICMSPTIGTVQQQVLTVLLDFGISMYIFDNSQTCSLPSDRKSVIEPRQLLALSPGTSSACPRLVCLYWA